VCDSPSMGVKRGKKSGLRWWQRHCFLTAGWGGARTSIETTVS